MLYFHQECIFSVVELENLFKAQQVFPLSRLRLMFSRAAAEKNHFFQLKLLLFFRSFLL